HSGSDTAIAGSVELKGSNDTVTKWRLATAKTMKISPKGMTTSAVKNFRMTIARSDRERRATGPQHRLQKSANRRSAYARAGGEPFSRFSRSRISLPVLKNGTLFWSTGTCAPGRGLRPARGGRWLT